MKLIIRISMPGQQFDIDVDDRFINVDIQNGTTFRLMECLIAHGIDPNDVIEKGGSLSFGSLAYDRFDVYHIL